MVKNQLDIIEKALEKNPGVIIIEKIQHPYNFPPRTYDHFPNSYRFEFAVAPKGGLYIAKELNKFMENLVPELKPAEVKKFDYSDRHADDIFEIFMNYGHIRFEEEIGKTIRTEKQVAIITDEEVLSYVITHEKGVLPNLPYPKKGEYIDGRAILYDDEKIEIAKRHVTICPYPNEKFFETVIGSSIKELKRKRPYRCNLW